MFKFKGASEGEFWGNWIRMQMNPDLEKNASS